MRSLKFPQMFNTNSSNVWKSSEYLEATKQNTELLLHCEKGELIGDPWFGLNLEQYLFNPNSYILRDILIDIIYNQIAVFIPQVKVKRENIKIIKDREKGKLYCRFTGINQIDYTENTYNLKLFDASLVSE